MIYTKFPPPSQDYRHQIVMVMLFAAIVNYIDRVNLSFAANDIKNEFGLSISQSGFLLAAWIWPYAIANLPSGWLIDKLGINKVFLGSIIIWSLATLGSGLSHSYTSLYISRVILVSGTRIITHCKSRQFGKI